MTALVIALGLVALLAVGASSSAGGDAPSSAVEVVVRGRATWVIGPASTLGVVVGGGAAQARAARGAVAAVSGPMFDRSGPEYLLLDVAGGVDVRSRWPARGATVAVLGDRATAHGGALVPMAVWVRGNVVAVQGYPRLVEGGRTVAAQVGDRTRRTALAVLGEGERVALVAFTGTMMDFGRELVDGGAREAVYLDGGRAAHLEVGGDLVVAHDAAERPASWVTLGRA